MAGPLRRRGYFLRRPGRNRRRSLRGGTVERTAPPIVKARTWKRWAPWAVAGVSLAALSGVLLFNGVGGGLLVVSQFTLAADTTGGNRPSFTAAAPPALGERLYDYLVAQARLTHPVVQTGRFAADMKVHLVNDGPVTIPLQIRAQA